MERPMDDPAFADLLTRLGGETLSFPHPAPFLTVLQTHISVVLLVGDFAYKIKKPVLFPFVDYSTLEKRREFCRLEVDLNRRLAEDVYLGVVPITRSNGGLEMDGAGEPVEYAVKMRRLPDDRRLNRLLDSDSLPENFWDRLAVRLSRFYREEAARSPEVSAWAAFERVWEDWEEVLAQVRRFPSGLLDPSVEKRLETLAHSSLETHRGRIDKRIGQARDGHGDLRLEHIYYLPQNPPPRDLAIIDCVEFNPRYRCADPLCDIAFLVMDLEAAGFEGHSRAFKEAFTGIAGGSGNHLLDFYVAYRHLVRGLVRGLQAQDGGESLPGRALAESKARAHFLRALGQLEEPSRRPCLLLLGGLPGAGKSTLSEQLAGSGVFQILSSDAARKELAGASPGSQPATGFEKGIYSPEWTERTYAALLARAESALRQGQRVLVDASFWREGWRERFQDLARRWGAPFFFFICGTGHPAAKQRLSSARQFGSDADYGIYLRMSERWEAPSPSLGALFLNTERPLAVNLAEIHVTLEQHGLAGGGDGGRGGP